ncbi:MAG TPA: hypothetical protein VFA28_12460, partial [Bryobacteraceae bacterium]|nr:hypothetical protein [Bryobacteraceae bacterium]
MTKREFLASAVGSSLALAQFSAESLRRNGSQARRARKAKTTKLFKSPPGFPNAVAVTSEGLWIAEQKL